MKKEFLTDKEKDAQEIRRLNNKLATINMNLI